MNRCSLRLPRSAGRCAGVPWDGVDHCLLLDAELTGHELRQSRVRTCPNAVVAALAVFSEKQQPQRLDKSKPTKSIASTGPSLVWTVSKNQQLTTAVNGEPWRLRQTLHPHYAMGSREDFKATTIQTAEQQDASVISASRCRLCEQLSICQLICTPIAGQLAHNQRVSLSQVVADLTRRACTGSSRQQHCLSPDCRVPNNASERRADHDRDGAADAG